MLEMVGDTDDVAGLWCTVGPTSSAFAIVGGEAFIGESSTISDSISIAKVSSSVTTF